MVERLIILTAFTLIGLSSYHSFNWWLLRRTSRLQANDDPLLSTFDGGRPGILYFTADYCVACKTQQRPALSQLRQRMGDDRVQIIQVDAQHQMADAERWGVMSLPTTFVLDPYGKPKAVNYGVATTEKLIRQLEQAIQP
jgi:thiol:disulfide interchange protein